MNYQKYIEQLKTQLLKLQASPHYDLVHCDIGRPQTIEEILEDTEEYISIEYEGMEDFKVWEPFKDFYQYASWINFGWVYLERSDSSQPPCGLSNIYSIVGVYDPYEIYIPEENKTIYVSEKERLNQPFKLYDEYRIFDRIAIENKTHVAVKFLRNQEEPIFYYYTQKNKSYYKMSIGFDEYLKFLLQTRGMSPWREFFIEDSNFRIDLARAEQFLKDLELLFPEVDRTIFESQLAKLSEHR